MTELLHRIDRYLNQAPLLHADAIPISPFTLFISRGAAEGFPSYARPTGPLLGELGPALEKVRAAFAARGLEPRWEFITELAPGLRERLEAAGFPNIRPTPLMAVTPESFVPQQAPGIEVRSLEPGGDLAPLLYAQRVAFTRDDSVIIRAEDMRAMETFLANGARFWGAYVRGGGVGAGVHIPVNGVTELAGIATLPRYQRRGIGGAVTAALASDAFAHGCDVVFLTAGDDRARRVYERVGFRAIGSGMTTMDPLPPD